MASKIYTKTGDNGTTSLIGGTKVPKSHLRIETYGTTDELNSFIGLLGDHLALLPAPSVDPPVSGNIPATTPSNAPSASGNIPTAAPSPVPATPSTAPAAPSPVSAAPPPTPSATRENTPATTTSTAPPTAPAPNPDWAPTLSFLREIQDRLFTIGSSLACDPEKEPKLRIPDLKEKDIIALEKSIDEMDSVLPPMKSFVLPGGHVAVSTAHIVRCICRRAERSCVRMQEEGLVVEPLVIRYLNRLSDYFFQLSRYIAHRLQAPETPWRPRL